MDRNEQARQAQDVASNDATQDSSKLKLGQKSDGPSLVKPNNPFDSSIPEAPALSLPKGGGAIRGIGEKFDINLCTGTASASIPIKISPGRNGFQPQLSLTYNSGSGNGPFGLGWRLSSGEITRKTAKGLPRYADGINEESDVFLIGGQEDLVPRFKRDQAGEIILDTNKRPVVDEIERNGYLIRRFSPRIEKTFDRIERWKNRDDPTDIFWRVTSGNNTTSTFGNTAESRISDPGDFSGTSKRIFSWLISETYDSKGNAILYSYKSEDDVNVPLNEAHEANRTQACRTTNRYLKRVRYGNTTPNRNPDTWLPFSPYQLPEDTWKFSVVFDYGEHDGSNPTPNDAAPWSGRLDPFSTFLPGFEVRTYRLCRRVLMFHHFSELGVQDYLVNSTELLYEHNPFATRLQSAVQAGYISDGPGKGYTKQELPPLEFEYSSFPDDNELARLEVQEIGPENAQNLPIGVDGLIYQWIDLDGEGLPGVITDQAGSLFYKRNTSANNIDSSSSGSAGVETAKFRLEALEELPTRPYLSVADEGVHFGDVAGAGKLDLIQMGDGCWGYFERTDDGEWLSFQSFRQFPNLGSKDTDVKFVDLTGDGLADILICKDQIFFWYPSLGYDGYGQGVGVTQSNSSSLGPACLLADFNQTIYLADMSGDGLQDLVRIRNSDVCYWPNIGYGRFGAMVQMDDAPFFDAMEIFNEKYIKLMDIDGSGTTDILYFRPTGLDIYLNRSGNGFAPGKHIYMFPPIDSLTNVTTADLFGNGTGCLVWSTLAPCTGYSMSYLDICKGKKPHLLTKVTNNLGAEKIIQYAPSTKFYLQDKQNNTPWITKLPFPVQCVEKTVDIDRLTGSRFDTYYSYHHGHFDGFEREFAGFARVEQWKTDHFALSDLDETGEAQKTWDVPMEYTKTWFHTGFHMNDRSFDIKLAEEYFKGTREDHPDLESTNLPADLDDVQQREASRALRGQILRTELYGRTDSPNAQIPYHIQESNSTITAIQPLQDSHGHGVFLVQARESMTSELSRASSDSRVMHNITLEYNSFGNALKSLQIIYGRKPNKTTLEEPHKSKQETSLLTYTEFDFTNAVDDANNYHVPSPCETRQQEITMLKPSKNGIFVFDELVADSFAAILSIPEIAFEADASLTTAQRRLIKKSRVLYCSDDLSEILPLGQLQSLELPGQAYDMAFTPGLLATKYLRGNGTGGTDNLISEPTALMKEAGYVDLDDDGNWWKPSRSIRYSSNTSDTPSQELVAARQNFFSPHRAYSPFNEVSFVIYDSYFLSPKATIDAIGNFRQAIMDYRVLQIATVIDENGNRSMTAFDCMGLVIGTAIQGKESEKLGDTLENFQGSLSENEIDQFFANPTINAAVWLLGNATTRVIYDYSRYYRATDKQNPIYTAVISRESHVNDAEALTKPKVQISFVYADGTGKPIQTKTFAGTGLLVENGLESVNRWVDKGWSTLNSKGKPVRSFQGSFVDSHKYKFDLKSSPVTVVLYDPLGHVVATLKPDHTFAKSTVEPWKQTGYDSNDLVLVSNLRQDPDVGFLLEGLPEDTYLPSWYDSRVSGAMGPEEKAAATKAALHANTPQVHHLDVMGRVIYTIDDNGNNELHTNSIKLDIRGSQLQKIDALSRLCIQYDYNICGEKIHEFCMTSGETWTLNDAAGKILYKWNTRGFRFRTVYDALQRPTGLWVSENGAAETLFEEYIYGEKSPDAEASNLRGKKWRVRDQCGIMENIFDFKGNNVTSTRQLAKEYKTALDLSTEIELEGEVFISGSTFDALNRPVTTTAHDGSVTYRIYNQIGLNEKVYINPKGENASPNPVAWPIVVAETIYNARGQATSITDGSGVITISSFDLFTYQLRRLLRKRGNDTIQDLNYSYDPSGNITTLRDKAQQSIFFRNSRIDPISEYTYDATYRLISATGREHLGQTGGNAPSATDVPNLNGDSPTDGSAMGMYEENYKYDPVGNILQVTHRGSDTKSPGWTREYAYHEASLINPGQNNDRLSSTSIGSLTETYMYDEYGNMISMPHLPVARWDCKGQLHATSKQVTNGGNIPETTYYVYNSEGERIRKVTESQAGAGSSSSPAKVKERIYLTDFEIFRNYSNGGANTELERTTLHIKHGGNTVAELQLRTKGTDNGLDKILRYQYSNYLGSVCLELDENARLISYEEYYPFGSTSYRAVASEREVPKRYCYSGKEKDDENGLYFYGARYYASWLGRWTAPDPSGESSLLYVFVRNNPIKYIDPDGRADFPPWLSAFMNNVLGTLAHSVIEVEIAARIKRIGDPSLQVGVEVPTLPGGTKSTKPEDANNEGYMDLVIGVIPPSNPNTTNAHIYELRAVTGYEGIEKKHQETVRYAQYFPPVFEGKQVASQGPGTAISAINASHPGILAPIVFRQGSLEFKITMWEARDKQDKIVPGVILYKISKRRRRDDDDDEAAEMVETTDSQFEETIRQEIYMQDQIHHMQVDLRSTVGSQAIMGQRVAGYGTMGASLALGIGGGILATGLAVLGPGAVGAGAVIAPSAASTGTGAGAGGVVLPFVARAAPAVVDGLSKAAGFFLIWRSRKKN